VADADAGATTTNPLDPDTDHGGVKDGEEDTNLNGKLDAGERDPNDPSDDNPVNGQGGAAAAAPVVAAESLLALAATWSSQALAVWPVAAAWPGAASAVALAASVRAPAMPRLVRTASTTVSSKAAAALVAPARRLRATRRWPRWCRSWACSVWRRCEGAVDAEPQRRPSSRASARLRELGLPSDDGEPEPRGATSETGGVELPLPGAGRELGGVELGGADSRPDAGARSMLSSTCGEISENPRLRSAVLVRSRVTVASAVKPSRRCTCINSSASSTSTFDVPGKPSMASDQAVRSGATARLAKSAIWKAVAARRK